MATDHTFGAPPSRGNTILVNIGCTANSKNADRKSETAYSHGAARSVPGIACAGTMVWSSVVIRRGPVSAERTLGEGR